jgi:hypothetical protein
MEYILAYIPRMAFGLYLIFCAVSSLREGRSRFFTTVLVLDLLRLMTRSLRYPYNVYADALILLLAATLLIGAPLVINFVHNRSPFWPP